MVTREVCNAFELLMKVIVFLMVMGLAMASGARGHFSNPVALSASSIPQMDLIQPAELAGMLKASGEERPVVFHVGSSVM